MILLYYTPNFYAVITVMKNFLTKKPPFSERLLF